MLTKKQFGLHSIVIIFEIFSAFTLNEMELGTVRWEEETHL